MNEWIDLRSDTVTQPTPAMREAMANAEVGDDVYGEDPSINKLQEMAAEITGKEAGLFVSSGTMGNLVSVLAHCNRGDEVIMGNLGHTFLFEGGGIAALGGVHTHTIPNQADGTLLLQDIKSAIREDNPHYPISRLLILENTQNRCGGVAITPEYTRQAASLVHENGLSVHIDGARIFNASAALNVPVAELCEPADSVTFCLSKGLCAPVGSVICGSKEWISKALRIRKMVGGGMRQAGILAAAGIVALKEIAPRLGEDHLKAKQLAQGLSQIPGLYLDPGSPYTNMVFLNLSEEIQISTAEVAKRLLPYHIKVGAIDQHRFRLVCHYWIRMEDVPVIIRAFDEVIHHKA